MNINLKLITLGLVFCALASVQATLVNPGFEDGLNGWTASDSTLATVVTDHNSSINGTVRPPYSPPWNHFLQIEAGPADQWITVSQSVTLQAGEVIQGFAAFSGYDDDPAFGGFNDSAAVWITYGSQRTQLWTKDIISVGSQGLSPWEHWSYTALNGGTYELTFQVQNEFDSDPKYSSYGLFTAVPEPSTWMAGCFVGLITVCSGLKQYRANKRS